MAGTFPAVGLTIIMSPRTDISGCAGDPGLSVGRRLRHPEMWVPASSLQMLEALACEPEPEPSFWISIERKDPP